jgi:hypothetical protein
LAIEVILEFNPQEKCAILNRQAFSGRLTFGIVTGALAVDCIRMDEYVMKSELPAGLVRIIERATHPNQSGPYLREQRRRNAEAA